jgi:glycerol uptake facilitator-like aquaporin
LSSSLARRTTAEALGTGFLLIAVVGSGMMAERLSGGSPGLALLANAIATGAALFALIHLFGGISGAHFNPAVTVALAIKGKTSVSAAGAYIAAQFTGAVLGVFIAHIMFDVDILQVGTRARTGIGQWTGEFVATFGLIALVLTGRRFAGALPAAIASYITGAYWFTSSTSFANPAVTLARSFTETFAGIGPNSVVAFMAAQGIATAAALFLCRWLDPAEQEGIGLETRRG